jgi:hypothetical protein
MRYILIILIIPLFSKFCFGQELTVIEPEAAKTELHQSNIGRIFFTEKRMPYASISKDNFLTNYRLTNKSNLFFVAFFNHSLTNYKHQILPQVSADSLYKLGNYHFTLFIDNKVVYQSNLLPGAPSAKNQNSDTYLNRPFIDNIDGQGSWSESFWNRFLSNGGDKVLTDGKHLLKMDIRPYVKTDTVQVGEIIATGELAIEVARHPIIDITKIQLRKITPYSGLQVSKPSFNRNRIRQMKGAINEGVFKKINSIVVLKHSKILIEEYFNGETRNSLHDPRSVGKSFTSTLTGIAINEGYIKSDKQPIKDFYNLNKYQNSTPAKGTTTIKDLLTMSSGFDGNDEDYRSIGNEENMYPSEDWVKFTLDLPYQDS